MVADTWCFKEGSSEKPFSHQEENVNTAISKLKTNYPSVEIIEEVEKALASIQKYIKAERDWLDIADNQSDLSEVYARLFYKKMAENFLDAKTKEFDAERDVNKTWIVKDSESQIDNPHHVENEITLDNEDYNLMDYNLIGDVYN